MPTPVIQGRVGSGPRSRLFIDGQPVGYATGVDITEDTQYEPIRVLDNIEVSEFVPIGYEASISTRRCRLVPGSPRGGSDLTFMPKLGGDAEIHLRNLLARPEGFDIQVDDIINPTTMALLTGAVATRRGWSVDARGIIGENIDFLGIRLYDESENP